MSERMTDARLNAISTNAFWEEDDSNAALLDEHAELHKALIAERTKVAELEAKLRELEISWRKYDQSRTYPQYAEALIDCADELRTILDQEGV